MELENFISVSAPVCSAKGVDAKLGSNLEIDALRMLKFQTLFLQYSNQEQNTHLMAVLLKTGFREEVLTNLNYLRGISGEPILTSVEVEAIERINGLYFEDEQDYFKELLKTGIIDVNRLYQLIVTHEQRHNFAPDFPTAKILPHLEQLKPVHSQIDLGNVDKVAVFGATYDIQKKRLLNALEYYREKKDVKNLSRVYLLSGFRRMYITELVQLGVITNDNLNTIKARYKTQNAGNDINNVRVQDLVDFLSKETNSDLISLLDMEKMKDVFKNIIIANQLFSTDLTPLNEDEAEHFEDLIKAPEFVDSLDTLALLRKFSLCGELDFFKLAAFELRLPKDLVTVVYSKELSGTNVMNGTVAASSGVRRANTQDTLRALFDINENPEQVLFVSNDQFVPQQHNAVLDVISSRFSKMTPIQTYGANANAGDHRNIAARHFALVSPVTKILGGKVINPTLLSGAELKVLNGLTPDDAYAIGSGKRAVELAKASQQTL